MSPNWTKPVADLIRDVKAHYNFPVRFPVWRCAEAQCECLEINGNKNQQKPQWIVKRYLENIESCKFRNSKEEQSDFFVCGICPQEMVV